MSKTTQLLLLAIEDWFHSLEEPEKEMIRILSQQGNTIELYDWYRNHPTFPMDLFNTTLDEMRRGVVAP